MEVESIPSANRRIGEVKRKMSALGTPNLGAIDEYARVSERYEYLASQRDDVLHAKTELETIVGDITREMTEIFVMRDRINRFVKEYETWFLIIAKFIGMMFVFSCVNSQLGYFEVLNNPMVNILLALICSIIPGSFSVFIVAAVIAAHMVKLSVLLAVLTVVVMLIVYLMFLKFAPGQSVVLLAVPVLMQYNLHYMIPILAGMYFSPYAVVPAVIGLFMVKFLGYACAAVSMTGTGMSINLEGATEAISTIFGQLADDSLSGLMPLRQQ